MFQEAFNVDSIDGVYWSLFVELKFYALVAIAMLLNILRYTKSLLAVWLIITIIERLFFNNLYIRYFLITDWSPYFIAGAAYYIIRVEGWCVYKSMLVVTAVCISIPNAFRKMQILETDLLTTYSFPVVISVVLSSFILMGLVAGKHLNILNKKSMLILGAMSYPLYLLHQFIGYILINQLAGSTNGYLTIMIVTVLVVFLSYIVVTLFERPFGKYLKKYNAKKIS